MNLRSPLLTLCALLPAFASCLTAGEEPKPDKELAVLEARLQAERATAIRDRLILYTDELQKLKAQYTTAGDTGAVATVQAELQTVERDAKRLAAIVKGEAEPAGPGELRPKEVLDDTALAARRINAIIERFSKARADAAPAPDRNPSLTQVRTRTFKMDSKAIRNREHASLEGSKYWAYDSSYVLWSLDDLAPGDYEIILHYTGSKCGGKALVTVAKQPFEVSVPKGKSEPKIVAGTVKVTERGTDIRVESKGLDKGADYLWNLQSLTLQPVAKRP